MYPLGVTFSTLVIVGPAPCLNFICLHTLNDGVEGSIMWPIEGDLVRCFDILFQCLQAQLASISTNLL